MSTWQDWHGAPSSLRHALDRWSAALLTSIHRMLLFVMRCSGVWHGCPTGCASDASTALTALGVKGGSGGSKPSASSCSSP
jgi:hypothetical protein